MNYSVVIRTLGRAGEKYLSLLKSLVTQTIKADCIIVYIAEGYSLPQETLGIETYVYVPKGMAAQRALKYDEVKSEYILFLDDDLYLPPTFVEDMFFSMCNFGADVISPDIYPNHKRRFKQTLLMELSGRKSSKSSAHLPPINDSFFFPSSD